MREVLAQTAQLMQNMGHHIEDYQLPITESFIEDFSEYWGFMAFMMKNFWS